MMIYLAGPIDDVSAREADDWRNRAADLLNERNLVAFFPNRAYRVNRNPSKHEMGAIIHTNQHAISCSFAVLVNLTGTGRAIGTIREIEFARQMHKPVIVVADVDLVNHFALCDCEVVPSLLVAAERINTFARSVKAEHSEAE